MCQAQPRETSRDKGNRQEVYREKKKLKQTQTKLNLADFKDFMEDYTNEISLVVNFITTKMSFRKKHCQHGR